MEEQPNPYASPQTVATDAPTSTGADEINPHVFIHARGRALMLIWSLGAVGLLALALLISTAFEYQLLSNAANGVEITPEEVQANDQRQLIVAITYIVSFLITVVLWCLWGHRSYRNLRAFTAEPLKHTPGTSVGYYFVPIINLFRPYKATREMWNGSKGIPIDEAAPTLVSLWWGAWIIMNIAGNINSRIPLDEESIDSFLMNDMVAMATIACVFPATLLAILVVRGIDRLQTERATKLGYLGSRNADVAPWAYGGETPVQ